MPLRYWYALIILLVFQACTPDKTDKTPPETTVEEEKPSLAPVPKKRKPFEEVFVSGGNDTTWWEQLRLLAPYDDLTHFDTKDLHKSKRVNIDSTDLWQMIHTDEEFKFHHLLLLRTFPTTGPFLPVVVNGEFLEDEKTYNFIKLVVVDTTFQKAPELLTLSNNGASWRSHTDFISNKRIIIYDSEDQYCTDSTASLLNRQFIFRVHPDNGIERLSIDTLRYEYCQ